ncbi:MAG: hypothetical protein JNK11_16485 [Alphaproteobacteria bacterium]|nr:hypothetical protein [Alphaproteobacteria bacterium]
MSDRDHLGAARQYSSTRRTGVGKASVGAAGLGAAGGARNQQAARPLPEVPSGEPPKRARRVGGAIALAAAVAAVAGVSVVAAWPTDGRKLYRSYWECVDANRGQSSGCEPHASGYAYGPRIGGDWSDRRDGSSIGTVMRGGFGSSGRSFASGG